MEALATAPALLPQHLKAETPATPEKTSPEDLQDDLLELPHDATAPTVITALDWPVHLNLRAPGWLPVLANLLPTLLLLRPTR